MNLSFTFIVLLSALIIDMELSNISDILWKDLSTPTGIFAFILVIIAYVLSQRYIFHLSEKYTNTVRKKARSLNVMNNLTVITEYLLIMIFIFLVTELLFLGRYDTNLLTVVLVASNILSFFTMIVLASRFYTYFRSHNSNITLLYFISSLIVGSTAIITIAFMAPILISKPYFIDSQYRTNFPVFSPGSIEDKLNYVYYIMAIISFISMWISTAYLMHGYSHKLGNITYWTLLLVPLVFYVLQVFVILFGNYFHVFDFNSIGFVLNYRIIFTISSTVGGILFGIPFLLVARRLSNIESIRSYSTIAAIGFVLFFVSGSATIYQTGYPPFGLATVSLVGISSYILLLGVYSSAISVSQDSEIRRQLKKSAEEWSLLGNIGEAEMEQAVINLVGKLKGVYENETGVEPSLTEDEAKGYFYQVANELKNFKSSKEPK
jgi:hypothetical protein